MKQVKVFTIIISIMVVMLVLVGCEYDTTASAYNNYILENSFVWEDEVPEDINMQLEIIQ